MTKSDKVQNKRTYRLVRLWLRLRYDTQEKQRYYAYYREIICERQAGGQMRQINIIAADMLTRTNKTPTTNL